MSTEQEEFNKALLEMSNTLAAVSTNMMDMQGAFVKAAKAAGLNVPELEKSKQGLNGLTGSTYKLTEAQKAQAQAEEILTKKLQFQTAALDKSVESIGLFAKGLLDSNVKLTNYGDAISKAGDAAFQLGKSFGIAGTLIGGAVKGIAEIAKANLAVQQKYFEARNELFKLGGAGTTTTESLMDTAKAAGLTAETIGRMTKPMKEMGSNIMILGSTAGKAQQEFGKLIQYSGDQRKEMMRLGISQEDMIKGTADYLSLQAMSGRSIRNEIQDKDKLRKSSLEYQTSLLELAALTGSDVDDLKKKQQEILRTAQVEAKNIQDENKARKLDAMGRREEAAAVRAETKARNAAFSELAGAPKQLQDAVKKFVNSGTYADEAQMLAFQGLQKEMEDYKKAIASGDEDKARAASLTLMQAAAQKGAESIDRYQSVVQFGSEEERKRLGVDTDMLEFYYKYRDGLQKKDAATIEAGIKSTKEGADKTANALAIAQEANIKASQSMESLIKTIDPTSTAFMAVTAAVVASTLALSFFAKKLTTDALFGGGGGDGSGKLSDILSSGKGKGGYLSKVGGVKTLAKGLGKGVAGLAGGLLLDYGAEKATASGHEKIGAGLDVGSTALSGAGTGAMIGSIIPGIGTAIGGTVGGLAGAGYGAYKNWGNFFGSNSTTTAATQAVQAKQSAEITEKIQGQNEDLSRTLPKLNDSVVSLDKAFKLLIATTGSLVTDTTIEGDSGSTGGGGGGFIGGGGGGDFGGISTSSNAGQFTKASPGPDSKVLDFVGKHESNGNYNSLVGGKTKTDPALTDMTVGQVLSLQSRMRKQGFETSALGKYQIIQSTLAGLVGKGTLSLDSKFNPSTQDKAAISLMNARGREKFRSGQLSVDTYADNLSKEWASLPYHTGKSFYQGVGSNKSGTNRSEFLDHIQARNGGIVSGPETGFPVTMHGNELIVPIDPNSILAELGKKSKQQVENEVAKNTTSSGGNNSKEGYKELLGMNYTLMNMLSDKLDSVINHLSDSNDTQGKILRYSQS